MSGLRSIWHPVFINGTFEFTSKLEAVATALSGWAICHAGGLGEELPEKFGEGMVTINEYVGETLSPRNIEAYADKLMEEEGIT